MIRHDPYAVAPPVGDWGYVVCDRPIDRAPRGSPRLLAEGTPFVRLGPDSDYRAWRNEFTTVFETFGEPVTLIVRGSLYLRKRESGADLADFEALVVDPDGRREIALLAPGAMRDAARLKVLKALDWYARERARREAGQPALLTSIEYWRGEALRARAS